MLGFGALAQFALAQAFSLGGAAGGGGSLAWRRILAQDHPGDTLNRHVPTEYLRRQRAHDAEAIKLLLESF